MDCCEDMEHMTEHHAHHEEHKTHGAHNAHSGHGSMGMGHGSATDFLRRFWIVTALLVPLALTNGSVAGLFHIPEFAFGKWIAFGLATIIFGFSLVFFRHAWHEIKMHAYGMMTLVSLAVGAGYLFSVASTFIPSLNDEFYLEIGTLVWVLLFGHYLEARSGAAAGDALTEVAKLLPKQVHLLRGGEETEIDIAEIKENDLVLVKPGEKVPADGIVMEGASGVNESLVSGESKPTEKKKDSGVIAGSIVLDGSLTVRLTRVGEHSTIGQIQSLIAEAKQTKPNSQRIADRASAVLTFVSLGVAIATSLVWSLLLGQSFVFAFTLAITVLVIACPHALGLAIPAVTSIATSLATKNGIFIKNLAKIETIRKADYVVFDKTGTLTKGVFGVTEIATFGVSEDELLRVAASLERHSSHVIGLSIIARAEEKKIAPVAVNDFRNIAGKGVRAHIGGVLYIIGNEVCMKESGISTDKAEGTRENGTFVFVAKEKELIGILTLEDAIKPESYKAIRRLHSEGVKVAMLTGDNETVAKNVAKELGIDIYFSGVLPEDKYKRVKMLQEGGSIVLMVGDGVNDAPALAQADAGIAIGAGTDVAVEAGDVVLMRSNPEDVARLIILSKKVYGKMIQNLVWALGYNVIAIPAAAGVFSVWGFFLRPEIGALVMSLSTVIVVANAVSLRRINLEHAV